MPNTTILEKLAEKGADIPGLVDQFIENNPNIDFLVNALRTEQSAKKFAYEKALRLISEKQPQMIYPYFDIFAGLLDHKNNFLKWGSIRTIANLTGTDALKKFEKFFAHYYAPIKGSSMVTAANIIGCTPKIINAKPSLADAVVCEILKAEKGRYELNGRLSPECRNVAIGHVIDALNEVFEKISDKQAVLKFMKRQLKNTRKPVAQRAEKFLRRHAPSKIATRK
jgi:hypothetical protein